MRALDRRQFIGTAYLADAWAGLFGTVGALNATDVRAACARTGIGVDGYSKQGQSS
jgi:hypothetical protein